MKKLYPFLITALSAKQLRHFVAVVVLCFGAFLPGKLFAQAPVISTFSPIKGPVGTPVTITGTGFNTTAANNVVFFGATRATVTAASATGLTVTVPSGATYAAITILNTGTALAAYSSAFFMPTFTPNTSGITAASFSPKVDFTAGTSPFSVAIADIDGDGKPDLAIVNFKDNTVSVLRNTGSPGGCSFAAKVDLAAGGYPAEFVAIGDIDGDGKPDLVVANTGAGTVSVLRNTSNPGSVSFAAKVDFPAGNQPISVAIGDIDGDGKPELVIAIAGGTNIVSVLRNTGSPGIVSFAAGVNLSAGTGPYSVAIGDIDRDGKPDLAFVNLLDNTVSVLRNTSSPGSISFAAKTDLATGTYPISVAIGDIDGDGKLDLAIANNGSSTVSVLRNMSSPGSVSFAAKVDLATGSVPASLAIGDIDGDGNPDIVTSDQGSRVAGVLRNNSIPGSISFAAEVTFGTGGQPRSVAIGDLDGDGKPDLVTTNASSNNVSVLRNTPVASARAADLFSLQLSAGTLSPAFDAAKTTYSAYVPNGTTLITVLPVTLDTGATVKVNGTAVASGTVSPTIFLNPGSNTINVVVTSADGSLTKTYTITVTRPLNTNLSNLTISSGTLSPVFDSVKTSYTATTTSAYITVTPTAVDPGDTIKVNGTAVNSGATSAKVYLNAGANNISIVVSSPDGSVSNTYTLTVTRISSVISADLSLLQISAGIISPVFASSKTAYTVFVPDTATLITLTPTLLDPGATVKVNGKTVVSGTISPNIFLYPGSNIINTVVTSADGATIKTYTITITRLTAYATNLSNLHLSNGVVLSPQFTPATTAYTASTTTASIAVEPVSSDTNSRVKVNGRIVASRTFSQTIPLSPGINVITTRVIAQDSATTKDYTITITRLVSSDASLTNLVASNCKLSPVFSPSTMAYMVSAGTGISTTMVKPTTSDPLSKVFVNGAMVASGTATPAIPLSIGPNHINIVVKAMDGTTANYTITINRKPSTNASLSNLRVNEGIVLSPLFAPATTSYTASTTATSIALEPVTADTSASVQVNGRAVTSRTFSQTIPLNIGDNTITTRVIAQDGTTKKDYTITVTRTLTTLNSVYEPISVSNPTDKPQLTGAGISVHPGLSPNGDGINDFLLIHGIANYPDNKLTIMNRAGQVIFEAKNYDNSTKVFDGHSNKTGVMQLAGTYFYALDYSINGAIKHKTGYIVIKY
ncbi:cadherin-like beta sandwich domain-containing protein [uncultured Mucilaginibacter sp.]|uniref:cadherin-like beta sandwich domain-containing protein n=1 Tax=uncultured Mucilaginibacter sp. TaxID=797541 RepID=UPI0025FD98F7|nr:cadherin-like beta sandwich domain-containing protein [uncultured Mucilaginibacter sp.]